MYIGAKVDVSRPRPRSFYGPDDWDGITPWQEIERDIIARQRAWDSQYLALPWLSRVKIWILGGITEPVGTSAGIHLEND